MFTNRRLMLLAAIALACLVAAVFYPIVGYDFIDYDLRDQVLENKYIRSLSAGNLKHILTSPCATSYYPVRTLTYAVDFQLWGLDAGGFKLTNGLIHLANVLLLYWLALRLFHHCLTESLPTNAWWDQFVAACCAGVFAVHPVVVEPVTWVAGREELLMTLGALGCLHFHISGRRLAEQGAPSRPVVACYAAAALCCTAACLSNAVGAVIPLIVVVWDILTLPQPRLLKIVSGTSFLWVIAAVTVALKKLGPVGDLTTNQPGMFSVERLAFVLEVYWSNLKTVFRPTQLALRYSFQRPDGVLGAKALLGAMAVVLTCGLLALCRRQKLVLFGLFWFLFALGPVSQIMPHHVHRADRFLYLPLAGLAIAMAAALRPLKNVLADRVTGAVIATLGLLGLLSLLSAAQVRTWRDSASVWTNSLRVDPKNASAHLSLADELAETGRYEEAVEHYRASLRLKPDSMEALKDYALLLAVCPREDLRDPDQALRLAERACQLIERPDRVAVAAELVRAEVHAQAGRREKAISAIEAAIDLARAAGEVELTGELRARLKLYQNTPPSTSSSP